MDSGMTGNERANGEDWVSIECEYLDRHSECPLSFSQTKPGHEECACTEIVYCVCDCGHPEADLDLLSYEQRRTAHFGEDV